MILYLWFQVKIKVHQRVNGDPFFDIYICMGYFSYFAIYGFFMLYQPPTIAFLSTRMFLQILFVDVFLIRLICKSSLFSGRAYVLSMEWLLPCISCILNFYENVLKIIDRCCNHGNRIYSVNC